MGRISVMIGGTVDDPRLTNLPPHGSADQEMPMTTAADVLKSKPHQAVHAITPDATVFDAVKLMAEKNVGALLVMEGERITGIVTERDYARKVVLLSRS